MNQHLPGSVRVDCAAKLNLFLEVLAKRDDGFHEIETLMAAVSLYDSLYLSSNSTGDLRLSCEWASGLEAQLSMSTGGVSGGLGELPRRSDNMIWRAVEGLRKAAGIEAGVTIRVIKRIPARAGLGGASSNAAAALLAARRLWRLDWPNARLGQLAADLGSDVPFFLAPRSAGAAVALARGRGERIERLNGMANLHVVVVKPPVGLATPSVYAACRPGRSPAELDELISALRCGNPAAIGACLFNGLQPAAMDLSPWIAKVQDAFGRLDCLGHSMSGSGSSYFGVFRHARHAARQAARLRVARLGYVFTARTVSVACRLTSAQPVPGSRRLTGK